MCGAKRKGSAPEVVPAVDDIDHARAVRAEASAEYREVLRQGFTVTRLAAALSARRLSNHFGDDIEITFKRKGSS